MPTFGADPDEKYKEWDESPPRRQGSKFDPRVMSLQNHFAYHKAMRDMTRLCPEGDKQILRFTFARLLRQGYTEQSLRRTIDRFFQSWAGDSERPAMLFSTTKVLSQILEEAEVVGEDPIMQWIIDGLPDVGPVAQTKEYRKAMILACYESLRYPDVIADIFRLGFGYETTYKMLLSLEQVVKYNLAGKPYDRRDVDEHLAMLSPIYPTLPKELRSHVPSPKGVRTRFDKMNMAVASSMSQDLKRRVKQIKKDEQAKQRPWTNEGTD